MAVKEAPLQNETLFFLKILYPSETLHNVCICSLFNDPLPTFIFLNLQRAADQPSAHAFCLPNSSLSYTSLIYEFFPTERHLGYWQHLHFLLDICLRSVWLHRVTFYCDRQTDIPGTFQQIQFFILWRRKNIFLSLT